jgi:hypothetical protein
VLVSLFAVVSSAASVSGQTMAGTGPAVSSTEAQGPNGYGGYHDFFAVDTSGTLWHANGSGTWDSLGGVSTSSPAAVSWGPGSSNFRLDVFVRSTDGALWHKYYQNGWSGWESLGGQLAPGTGAAVASWSAGRLDVFVEGTNGALWHKWWNGAQWSGWQNLGGKLTASPAATSGIGNGTPSSRGQIEVFVRGTDGAVWQKNWNGTISAWSTWASLGGQVAPNTGPAVSQTLVLFVQGTDHQLWHRNHWGSWSSWATLGGKPSEALSTASPAAVTDPDLHTTVCVSTTSGNVWYSENDVTGLWPQYTWSSISGPP